MKKLLIILLIFTFSCTNNKNNQKERETEILVNEEVVTSYVIVIYEVVYYELDEIGEWTAAQDMKLKNVNSEIIEVENFDEQKEAKLKDKFYTEVSKFLEYKNQEYLKDVDYAQHKILMTDESLKILRERKPQILDRKVRVFNTYKEASDFSFNLKDRQDF